MMNAADLAAADLAAAYGARLAPVFAQFSCKPVSLSLLQPAETFFELIGEDVRARLLIASTPTGQDTCLRPEFTIPVCREHLAKASSAAGRYAYFGTVFRFRPGGTSEFAQAGIELIDTPDPINADVQALTFAVTALARLDAPYRQVRLGDKSLFAAIVDAMDIPAGVAARLLRYFGDDAHLKRLISEPFESTAGAESVSAIDIPAEALEDQHRLTEHIEDRLARHGLLESGGRSAEDIATRYWDKRQLTSGKAFTQQARATLQRYLMIDCPLQEAAKRVSAFVHDTGLESAELARATAVFKRRLAGIADAGIPLETCRFSARFGRRLDYYTGFVFDIIGNDRDTGHPLAGGGRYDKLLQRLGAKKPTPAVGCALWLGRIARAVSRQA